jgi:hypothetical protein
MFNNKKLIYLYENKIEELEKKIREISKEKNDLILKINEEEEILKICKENKINSKDLKNFLTLEKCHFCFEKTIVSKESGFYEMYGSKCSYLEYFVECPKCKAKGPKKGDVDTAIKEWNKLKQKGK